MASWTNVTDAATAIGAPPRSADIRAIRDNITAAKEGAPGAPRLSPWALAKTITQGDTIRYADDPRRTWQSRCCDVERPIAARECSNCKSAAGRTDPALSRNLKPPP